MRFMSGKLAIATATLSLTFAALAIAAPQRLDVKTPDSDAELTLKLVKRNGVPTKMTGVSISNLEIQETGVCNSVIASHDFGQIPITRSFVTNRYTFSANEVGEFGLTFNIYGELKSGARWEGAFKATGPSPANCTSGDVAFSARKRN